MRHEPLWHVPVAPRADAHNPDLCARPVDLGVDLVAARAVDGRPAVGVTGTLSLILALALSGAGLAVFLHRLIERRPHLKTAIMFFLVAALALVIVVQL